MAKKKTAEKAAEAVVEEKSVLDSLFDQVDLETPQEGAEGTGADLSRALNVLIHTVVDTGRTTDRVDKVLVDGVIAELDNKISAQVNEILHNEEFQKLESAWRGLKTLIDRTDFRRNIKVEVLNVSKEELRNDFEEATGTIQSGLYKHVYEGDYDTPGGDPVGAILGNYEFDHSLRDVSLLRNMAKISSSCHAPFIASVGSKFFGQESIEAIPKMEDIGGVLEAPEYGAWRSFRDSEDSRYVGLTMPRFLLRLPYGEDNPAKSFTFEEEAAGEDHHNYLWGNASFAFGTTLTQSFADNGWCVNIRGPQSGGRVDDLPVHFFEAAGETAAKVPTEVLIPDNKEFELSELGFIPLSFYKGQDYGCFFSANSTQKPKEYTDDAATANSRLCARLPYLFLVSRLAHYLKVIQRENIGAGKESEELRLELKKWINTLVTEMKNPDAQLKARCPLSAAEIDVTGREDNPGFYDVTMKVRPHFQIEGVNVDLSLVSQLPKGKS